MKKNQRKNTRRKAFNFLRSYYDVFNKLEEEDKLQFIKAILDKQFLDQEPEGLNWAADLAYESQRHIIELSVKGWKRTSNEPITDHPTSNPMIDPTTNPMSNPKEEEEEEEEKEEEKEKEEEELKGGLIKKNFFEPSLVLEAWNNRNWNLPKIKVLTQTRARALEARAKEHGMEAVRTVIAKTEASDMMNGINDRGWVANFDWVFKKANFVKILEGNYDNRLPKAKKQKTPAEILKQQLEQEANNLGNDF